MSTLMVDIEITGVCIEVTDETLSVELSDGRTLSVPIAWFPRLVHGAAEERNNWRFIAKGHGIHWPDLDEDISIDNLLAGKRSGESPSSLKRWLNERQTKQVI